MNGNKGTVATDTIAAVATGAAPGGIGIVRISGPQSLEIGSRICGLKPEARRAYHRPFNSASGVPLDHGIFIYFQAPHSYTGEDVVELQGHGGRMAPERVLRQVLALGARRARPGEFTERAFLNGRLDLAQAEAVADLIASSSEAAARAAMNSLQGVFSRQARELGEEILRVRVLCEAHIDFPDEELESGWSGKLEQLVAPLIERISALLQQACQGRNLVEGSTVVLAGPPNAGKSSLLNALSGEDSAIVTSVPGTTRDVLRESLLVEGVPVTLLDTAGLRDTDDPIEREGVRRSEDLLARADHVLIVLDGSATSNPAGMLDDLPAAVRARTTVIWNKVDLLPEGVLPMQPSGLPALSVSALRGDGLQALRAHLRDAVAGVEITENTFSARKRHIEALEEAAHSLARAAESIVLGAGLEIVAEDLRFAHESLGRITGEVTSDDLLGEIFAGFCIGK